MGYVLAGSVGFIVGLVVGAITIILVSLRGI